MRPALLGFVACAFVACAPASAAAQSLDGPTVMETVEALQPGEFLWMPEVAPEGPVLLVVNVRTQRAIVYRNGVPIGVSTVSTGSEGHETPLGVFTILQKRERHFSNLYNNAPMPFMQRLTWGGVALHGGHLPGYPASHGCIRLPHAFARLVFGVTRLGMTVAVVDQERAPSLAADAALPAMAPAPDVPFDWNPERAPDGPVSVLVSTADSEVIVLRNGVRIGQAPIRIATSIAHPTLYTLQSRDANGLHWLRLALPGQAVAEIPSLEGDQLSVPDGFRQRLLAILEPGATVVVTNDTFRSRRAVRTETLLDTEAPSPHP